MHSLFHVLTDVYHTYGLITILMTPSPHLIIQDATRAPELFAKSALVYVNYAEAEVEKHFNFIRKFKAEELESYR